MMRFIVGLIPIHGLNAERNFTHRAHPGCGAGVALTFGAETAVESTFLVGFCDGNACSEKEENEKREVRGGTVDCMQQPHHSEKGKELTANEDTSETDEISL